MYRITRVFSDQRELEYSSYHVCSCILPLPGGGGGGRFSLTQGYFLSKNTNKD